MSLNFSALAKITDGFTPGHMVQAVDTVLNERRIRQLSSKSLAASEFMGSLSRQEPVYKEEEEAFKVRIMECLCGDYSEHDFYDNSLELQDQKRRTDIVIKIA